MHHSFDLILPFFPPPVQALLLDSTVSDLMLNASGSVFTDRNGRLGKEEGVVVTAAKMQAAAENILSLLGGYISAENPIQDSRLPDGARVAVVGPPCSPNGFTITIRKFNHWFTLEQLIEKGTVPPDIAEELKAFMLAKKNILVSGGTSSGKTTLLNAFVQEIPAQERLIVIEKPSELQLDRDNVVRWEAIDELPGRPEVTVGRLLSAALRHRPDRIIVGEVRGSTAYDLLQALNTGHSGTFSTVHADNAAGALERISGLALSAHANLNHSFVRSETANAIHYVVHAGRDVAGVRCVTEVIAVKEYSHTGNRFVTEQVYRKETK
ncbi:MAG: ATPase, T2SS/T4P/T4SS family [Bryobacteraceae bacterium]